MLTLKQMIDRAGEAGACEEALEELRTYKDIGDVKDNCKRLAEYACWYAACVLKGPFPEGEEVIAASAQYSCWYARNVLKGALAEGGGGHRS